MSVSSNSVDSNKINASLASNATRDQLDSNKYRQDAEGLINKSVNHQRDADKKQQEAKILIDRAKDLEKKADSIRKLAEIVKNKNQVDLEKVQAVTQIASENNIDIPVPKNMSPDEVAKYLDAIADRLESIAKSSRDEADSLLRDSEHSRDLAKQTKQQAEIILNSKDDPELKFKIAKYHNQGLLEVFKMLGVNNIEEQYKKQVEYAHQKEIEDPNKHLI